MEGLTQTSGLSKSQLCKFNTKLCQSVKIKNPKLVVTCKFYVKKAKVGSGYVKWPRKYEEKTEDQIQWEKLMLNICNAKDAAVVMEKYRLKGNLDQGSIYGSLVRLKQMKRWKSIIEILNWLKSCDWWKMSAEDYRSLVGAYGKSGQLEDACTAFEEGISAGFEMGPAGYTMLIEAFAKKGKFQEAEKLFQRMKENGVRPTVVTYHTLIDAHGKVQSII